MRYISHEIRTPLNTVFLGLQLLHDEVMESGDKPEWEESVNEVRDSCYIALSILNDLLANDKLEEGLLKLELTEECAWSFIHDSVRPFLIQVQL